MKKYLLIICVFLFTIILYAEEKTSRNVPVVYYINEAGVMVGDFYYNTNLFKNKTKYTGVFLYSPSTEIFTLMSTLKEYPLSDNFKLGSKLRYIKFSDIHNGWPGNNSSDEQEEIIYNENYGYIPSTMGYTIYKGNTQSYDLNLTYKLTEKDELISTYKYETVESQKRTHKSDTLSLMWDRTDVDNKSNPRKGYKVISGIKKSLNMLGHDDENNWDYFKLSFDFRKYIPVFKKSTFAVRFYTESTGGKEVTDKERTFVLKNITGDSNAEVSYYAPFFDNALLGDLQNFKGYYFYRFYDKHMALLQMELRFPMDKVLKGMQGNLFGEIGRVSNEYDLDMFTKDLKSCFGFGIRYYFNEDVIMRGDFGISDEASQMRINEGQVF